MRDRDAVARGVDATRKALRERLNYEFALPTMSAEIFAARAWILNEPADHLAGFVDLPWRIPRGLRSRTWIAIIDAEAPFR